jgi:death-on-curing protein
VIEYLSVAQVLELHRAQLRLFGGAPGIGGRGALEAAVARAASTFDGDDLYPDLAAKAAAMMHSLVQNHPFVDGNERVGAAAAELLILLNDGVLAASDAELEAVTMSVARGEIGCEVLTVWLRQRLVPAP